MKISLFKTKEEKAVSPAPVKLGPPRWKIIDRVSHPKYETLKYVLCERCEIDGTPEYQRLFRFSVQEADKGDDFLIEEIERYYDNHLFAHIPKKWAEYSTHFQELVIRQLQGEPGFNQADWFRGLDFNKLWEEIRGIGFKPADCLYGYKYSLGKIKWDKTLKIHPNGREEISLYFIPSVDLHVGVDWTGVDVMSIIRGPKITFPVRDEPFPELDVVYVEPTPQIIYTSQQPKEDNTPRCPTCRSTDIEKVGTLNKVASIELMGLASKKIGKQFKCKNCGYYW